MRRSGTAGRPGLVDVCVTPAGLRRRRRGAAAAAPPRGAAAAAAALEIAEITTDGVVVVQVPVCHGPAGRHVLGCRWAGSPH